MFVHKFENTWYRSGEVGYETAAVWAIYLSTFFIHSTPLILLFPAFTLMKKRHYTLIIMWEVLLRWQQS